MVGSPTPETFKIGQKSAWKKFNFLGTRLSQLVDLDFNKAATARIFDKTTSYLATLAQSGRPLFGIQESNLGKVVIFGGGVPVILDGTIVGAVGASAGTVEQDMAVAEAAITALGHQAQSSDDLNLKPTTLKGKQI